MVDNIMSNRISNFHLLLEFIRLFLGLEYKLFEFVGFIVGLLELLLKLCQLSRVNLWARLQ